VFKEIRSERVSLSPWSRVFFVANFRHLATKTKGLANPTKGSLIIKKKFAISRGKKKKLEVARFVAQKTLFHKDARSTNMGGLCKVVLKLYKFKEFLKIIGKFQVFKKPLPHINEA
jgi:hypothetical protein